MVHNYFLMKGMIQFLQSMHESHLAYVEEKILLQWKSCYALDIWECFKAFLCIFLYERIWFSIFKVLSFSLVATSSYHVFFFYQKYIFIKITINMKVESVKKQLAY